MENFSIFDLIGYLAIIFSFFGFLSHKTYTMKINGIFSTVLFGISIYSYHGVNGLFVSFISVLSKILSFIFNEKQSFYFKLLSPIIALLFFLFFNKEGFIGILPALSLIFIIFADFQQDIIKMKIIYFFSAFCWLLYGILLHSLPAILFDVVGIISLTYSIFKIQKKRKFQLIENNIFP